MSDFDDTGPIATDEVDTSAPVDTSQSIDDAINAALASQEGATDADPAETQQQRDERGRFAAKAAQDAAAAAVADPEAQAVQPVTGQAPAAWGKDKAALFAALPPEAQAFIAQREQQISEGFKTYEGLAPFAESARANGLSLRDVMTRVQELEDAFATDPVAGFHEIMRRSGYDAMKIAQAVLANAGQQPDAGQQQAPAFDPRVIQSLQQEIQSLKMQPFVQQVEAFASDPANKHFERLSPVIKQLLAADPQLSLPDAYNRACWSDPQVRTELMAEQTKQQQLAKSTQTALRASKGLAPGTAPLNGQRRMKTVDDAIEAAMAATGF